MAAAEPLSRTASRPADRRLRLAERPAPAAVRPRATTAPTFADAAYAATLALLLAVGIIGVLLLNTATQTQADRIAAQKQQLATLALKTQLAQVSLDEDGVPSAVAARARALQLRPASRLPVLRLSRAATFAPPRPAKVSARAPAARRARAG